MEVHPPHEPIHTKKDFFIHLFTITIGLLIAVGIEGIVEWRHHVHLVNEAKETVREEVKANLQQMTEALPKFETERKTIEGTLQALKKIQDNPNDKSAQNMSVNASFVSYSLRDTAWKTAQSTGALSYMPYSDAERYTEIYQGQSSFLEARQKLADDQSLLVGLITKYNLFTSNRISKEQADNLAERLGIWRAHLVFANMMAKVNAASYQAFLENKPGPTEMHEDMSGPGK